MPITTFNKVNANRIYFKLSSGKFNYKRPENREERLEANAISGVLTDIVEKETSFNDATIKVVEFHLSDRDLNGNHYEYVIPINREHGNFKRIIMSLASVKDFRLNTVEFIAYLDKEGKYSRVSLKYNGEKLGWYYDYKDWIKEQEKNVDGEIVKIRKPMNDFYSYLLDKTKAALKGEVIEVPNAFKDIPHNAEVETQLEESSEEDLTNYGID